MEQGAMVQGVILLGVQRFARERFGPDFWRMVESDVNTSGRLYLPSQTYPMSEVDAVIGSVSRHSGMTVPLVLESIGDYVAPDMFGAYASLIDPQWNLLDVLLRIEAIVERAALKHGIKLANSPLEGRAGSNGEMVLSYQSPWRICPLIKGLVRGLGAHLNQPVTIDEVRCMSTGSSACEFAVKVQLARPARQRMGSVPDRMGFGKSNPGERLDRASSLPPAPSPRPDTRSAPGLLAPHRFDRNTPMPPEPSIPPARPSNPPPPFDSDSGPGGYDTPGHRRR
jgi:hypothetical protein